ncbi:MAG: hypothetical protein ACRBB3_09405 [Alphaproteobacteria bacterium]
MEYQTPALLYIVCAMSAMAFVTCSFRWLLQAGKNFSESPNDCYSFDRYIWQGQIKVFVFVMVISIFIGMYDFYYYGRQVQIYGELVILFLFFAVSFLLSNSRDISIVLFKAKEVFFFGGMCLLGWIVTIGLGLFIGQILKLVSVIERESFNIVVIFISGALWNFPVIWGYNRVLQDATRRNSLNGKGFHKFLWPILFAYLIILVPLVTQDMVNSEKWRKMENAKPMREI